MKNSEQLSRRLAEQLIEQGLRSMHLIENGQEVMINLPQEFLPITIREEERMVFVNLNADQATQKS